jgi:hypothetical protein
MMKFETYCNKYRSSYERLAKKLCILDAPYNFEQLQAAWRTYTGGQWYAKAFKPYALAQSNVRFYDYQIRLALADKLTYHDDKSLLDFKELHPDTFEWAVKDYYTKVYEEEGGSEFSQTN